VIGLAPFAFGVHPSLLPRHRGADPYYWTLARRDEETGVTAHRLTPEYDDGAILSQVGLSVPEGCNSWQLARALDRPSLSLLREIAGQYARGEEIEAQPQDEEQATMAPAPSDDDCELRWDESVDDVLARIRAGAPEPGAFTGYGDDTIVITRARPARAVPAALEPGDVAVSDEGVVVRTGDGAIVLLEARREGEDRTLRDRAIVEIFPGIVVI
jgi:methionyl-tRNA formyltransferase